MKKEALEVLRNRRSIRKYKSTPVPEELLDIIMEAGAYAPTAGGGQAATMVAVTDPEKVRLLSRMNARVMGSNGDPYYGAPAVILVLGEADKGAAQVDGHCVMVNLLNAAYAVGLGSCWIDRERQMFETDEGKALLKSWGIEGDFVGVAACILGYPDGDAPEAKPRKEHMIYKVK